MDERVERRRPDRHQFVLRFLRRIAVAALVLAAALWTVPRGLVALGLLGPTAHDRIEEAARAIAAARAYGSGSDPAPLKAAEQSVATARALANEGKEREARREAARATASAIEAQKMALVARTAVRQRAEAVYKDLERQINELEKLYERVTPGMSKEQTTPLLSLMKATRVATGELFLAYEKEDFGAVVDGERRAREAVEAARETLESARSR
jgi:hypothetical protein